MDYYVAVREVNSGHDEQHFGPFESKEIAEEYANSLCHEIPGMVFYTYSKE